MLRNARAAISAEPVSNGGRITVRRQLTWAHHCLSVLGLFDGAQ